MFTLEELLSTRNQSEAFEYLGSKKDGSGTDGVLLSELEEYWELNGERIVGELEAGMYQPGVVKSFEITNHLGKRRRVSNLCTVDRFLSRLLAQMLEKYLAPEFLANSFAYQEGKGTLEAVMKAKEFLEQGSQFVAVLDIQDYFDSIPLDKVMQLLRGRISDERIMKLISGYLYCKVEVDGHIYSRQNGLLQGSPISPILSNLYLHDLDGYMEEIGYHWIRFADNIYLYDKDAEAATRAYNDISSCLEQGHRLTLNRKKSGVYEAVSKGILGYDFLQKDGQIEILKHHYQRAKLLHYWQPTTIQRYNQEYHIISDGILTKKDYALLFENEEEKHHIPVEVVNQMNFYSDVVLTTNVLKTLSENRISASFFDKYGNLVGSFVPEKVKGDGSILLKQCALYNDERARLDVAKQIELAAVHNMRSNIRYYNKKKDLQSYVEKMDEYMEWMEAGQNIEELLLVEARARQEHFERTEDGGVYLSKAGKRVFLTEFQQKLNSQIVIKGKAYTYGKLMSQEVREYCRFVSAGGKYRPYKYY